MATLLIPQFITAHIDSIARIHLRSEHVILGGIFQLLSVSVALDTMLTYLIDTFVVADCISVAL
jgi:hypothetical protein